MHTRTILSLLLATTFFASCASAQVAIPTITPFITQPPLSTQVAIPSSTSESWSTSPIIIALAQETEYHREVSYPLCKPSYLPIPNAGCMFMISIVDSSTQIDLGNSYQVIIQTPVDRNESLVTIVRDGKEVYKIRIQRYTFSGLISAWGYENHWAIEVANPGYRLDIIQDGESLSTKNNYDKACGFQILNGKPFYFFKKSGFGYGVNYDGVVSHLDYDNIVCSAENPNADPHIVHYQNAVTYAVKIDGKWKYAIVTTSEP